MNPWPHFFWVLLLEGSSLKGQVLDSEAKIMAADLVSPWVQDCFMGPRQAKPVTAWHGKDTCQSSLLAFWARPCHWALTFENIWHSWRVTVSYARQDYIVWYILCLPMCSVENRLHWKGEGICLNCKTCAEFICKSHFTWVPFVFVGLFHSCFSRKERRNLFLLFSSSLLQLQPQGNSGLFSEIFST